MEITRQGWGKKYSYYIGIDCGVETGIAAWCPAEKKLYSIETLTIHRAMEKIRHWNVAYPGEIFIRVEDARQAVFGRQKDIYKAKGAGSIMRDAKIWEDFLIDLKIPFEMVRPNKSITKLSAEAFKKITGCEEKTSNHARDSAMLVFGI